MMRVAAQRILVVGQKDMEGRDNEDLLGWAVTRERRSLCCDGVLGLDNLTLGKMFSRYRPYPIGGDEGGDSSLLRSKAAWSRRCRGLERSLVITARASPEINAQASTDLALPEAAGVAHFI
jgi:hypothetical protein